MGGSKAAGERGGQEGVVMLRVGPRGSLLREGAVRDLLEAGRKRQLEQVFFGCNVFRKAKTGTSMKQRAVVAKAMLERSGVEGEARKLEEEWKEDAEREEMMGAFEQVRKVACGRAVVKVASVC